ncbi:MAG: lipoyl(octanoyl) transferase LipB [Chloroflexia bacterium]|nr:lipoyl(octanoyl) transferase LipB [Chloroflexia bacterium]
MDLKASSDDSAGTVTSSVEIRRPGLVPYQEAWDVQRALLARIVAEDAPETLLLLEHPPTYTLGRRGGREHLLATPEELAGRGAVVIESDRGGDITYHGPGQIVGYPLLNLRRRTGGDVHRYLRALEEVLIGVLAAYGLTGEREPEHTGVWCGGAKVAAIGVRISRGITMHGFALNVNTDLSYFNHIVPCGIHDRPVTSLAKLLGEQIPMDEVTSEVERRFQSVFGPVR